MSARREHRLGYSFAPVPERVVQAYGARRLSVDELGIIIVLYERANLRALEERCECLTITLRQLAHACGSTELPDTFGKRLRRLSKKPEAAFRYRVEGADKYVFTLLPDPPDASDIRPRSAPDSDGDSDVGEDDPRPRKVATRPSSEPPADGSVEPGESRSPNEDVRSPQTSQINTNPSVTERFKEKHLSKEEVEAPAYEHLLPEVREAIEKARRGAQSSEDVPKPPESAPPECSDWPYDPEADVWAERIRAWGDEE
jgi:hypothetical protein